MKQDLLNLLVKVGEKIDQYSLMGSKWGNCEAEVIAAQALASCAYNYKTHGDAFSFYTKSLGSIGGNGLVNNPKGVGSLVNDGSIVVEEYTGSVTPDNPDKIVQKKGKYVVLRVSEALILYAAGQIHGLKGAAKKLSI